MSHYSWRAAGSVSALALLAGASACRHAAQPDAYGNIEATEVVVGAQAMGQLKSFTPVEGNRLALGQLVAVVDTSTLTYELAEALADRAASAARVDEVAKQTDVLATQRNIAERNYARTQRLHAELAATSQQLDQAERDYRTLVAQIAQNEAQQQSAAHDVVSGDARASQIRDQIRKSRVTNPVAGTVLTTYAKAGEVVQAGQPLYKIANLDTMELRAYVTEPQLAQIKLGHGATVTIDAGDGQRRSFPGVVSWISSQAEFTPTPIQTRDERANLVYAIKIRVANPNGVLKIGMPADVTLTTVAVAQ